MHRVRYIERLLEQQCGNTSRHDVGPIRRIRISEEQCLELVTVWAQGQSPILRERRHTPKNVEVGVASLVARVHRFVVVDDQLYNLGTRPKLTGEPDSTTGNLDQDLPRLMRGATLGRERCSVHNLGHFLRLINFREFARMERFIEILEEGRVATVDVLYTRRDQKVRALIRQDAPGLT